MLGIGKEGLKRVQRGVASRSTVPANNPMATTTSPAATTITTASGQVMSVSEIISQLDEAARRRLERMNEKLRGLEMQMEVFEAEISRANDTINTSMYWS